MKKQTNQFRELLMLTPVALMLLASTNAYSQDKEPTHHRAPSIIQIGDGDPEIALETQGDKEPNPYTTISPAEREILEAEAKKEGREIDWEQIAKNNKETISGENENDDESLVTETKVETEVETVVTEIETKDETVTTEVKADTETIESLKKKLAAKTQELETLRASISDDTVNTSEEVENLNAIILSAEKEISTLSSQISDLKIETELAVADKKSLEAQVIVVETELEEIKALLAEKEVKIAELNAEKTALEEEKIALVEDNKKLKEKNTELETITCKQEDRLAKLEAQVSASSSAPDMMAILMMQQQQMMMSMTMMMNSGFPMTQAPSLSNGNDNLNMMMMMQSMVQENRMSNFQNGIYGMLGSMNRMTPTYQITGDYFNGGQYPMMNQGQPFGQQAQQQNQMMNNPQMMMQPFNYNMNRTITSGANTKPDNNGTSNEDVTTTPDLTEDEVADANDAGMA
jgi:vacuolar-type H+-ATPase subunit I/STV1